MVAPLITDLQPTTSTTLSKEKKEEKEEKHKYILGHVTCDTLCDTKHVTHRER